MRSSKMKTFKSQTPLLINVCSMYLRNILEQWWTAIMMLWVSNNFVIRVRMGQGLVVRIKSITTREKIFILFPGTWTTRVVMLHKKKSKGGTWKVIIHTRRLTNTYSRISSARLLVSKKRGFIIYADLFSLTHFIF